MEAQVWKEVRRTGVIDSIELTEAQNRLINSNDEVLKVVEQMSTTRSQQPLRNHLLSIPEYRALNEISQDSIESLRRYAQDVTYPQEVRDYYLKQLEFALNNP